jgi:hypothetical protein
LGWVTYAILYFEVDKELKDLCTIVTPFAKFKYNIVHMAMGFKCFPHFAQEVMGIDNIFRNIAEAKVYIPDIGVFLDSWEQHMTVLQIVLQKLHENGFLSTH